jgi:pimeloyl-ACP methyl ester carboxylesterase
VSGYVNQALIQVDVLRQLSSMVRSGSLTANLGAPKSVVLVGHSFGSFISNALLGVHPDAADAVVMTGIAYVGNASGYGLTLEALNSRIASTQNNAWGSLDTGYLTWVDVYANIINFFKAPLYTIDTAKFAESTKQPFAVTELLSLLSLDYSAPRFTGPVLFLTGEFDYIVCEGFCPGQWSSYMGRGLEPVGRVGQAFSPGPAL